MSRRPLMHRLLKWAAIAAIAVAVLVWPLKALLAAKAHRVVVVSEHSDPTVVRVNEATFDPDDFEKDELRSEVISIYGVALSEEDVLFIDESRLVRPKYVSGLTLLLTSADENPLKMDSVNFFTPLVSMGAAVTAVLLLGILRFLKRRRTSPASSA